MRRPVELRGFEESDVIGLTLMAHECVQIPARWRRPPGRVLRWDDYVEPLSWGQQRLTTLQPLSGIQERTALNAERLLGLLRGEHRPAGSEQTTDVP